MKLKTYQRIAGMVVAVGVVLGLVALLIGVSVPAMVLGPATIILLLAAIIWVISILLDRRNAHANAIAGRSWLPDSRDAK